MNEKEFIVRTMLPLTEEERAELEDYFNELYRRARDIEERRMIKTLFEYFEKVAPPRRSSSNPGSGNIQEAINDIETAISKLKEIDERLFLEEDSVLEYLLHARGTLLHTPKSSSKEEKEEYKSELFGAE